MEGASQLERHINDQVLNLELFRGSILKINDYYLALSEIDL